MILDSKENDMCRIDLGDLRLLVHETDRHLAIMEIHNVTPFDQSNCITVDTVLRCVGLKVRIFGDVTVATPRHRSTVATPTSGAKLYISSQHYSYVLMMF